MKKAKRWIHMSGEMEGDDGAMMAQANVVRRLWGQRLMVEILTGDAVENRGRSGVFGESEIAETR